MGEQDVWKFIHFRDISVSRCRRRDQDIYITLAAAVIGKKNMVFNAYFAKERS